MADVRMVEEKTAVEEQVAAVLQVAGRAMARIPRTVGQRCDRSVTHYLLGGRILRATWLTEHQGPARRALSALKLFLLRGALRLGGGLITTPMARRIERLFGAPGSGRMCFPSAGLVIEVL